MLLCFFFVFFFKQKTAYEMRISDWSSDVCSSDLRRVGEELHHPGAAGRRRRGDHHRGAGEERRAAPHAGGLPRASRAAVRLLHAGHGDVRRGPSEEEPQSRGRRDPRVAGGRSEEHTSELQSLMRISYAVFSLKKKKQYQ